MPEKVARSLVRSPDLLLVSDLSVDLLSDQINCSLRISCRPKQRYSLINRQELAKLLGIKDEVQLIESSDTKKHLSNCVMSVYNMIDLYT